MEIRAELKLLRQAIGGDADAIQKIAKQQNTQQQVLELPQRSEDSIMQTQQSARNTPQDFMARFRIPDNPVALTVPAPEFRAMQEQGEWPERDPRLVFVPRDALWYVAPDHPDAERLIEAYGPDNDEARARWQDHREQAMLTFNINNRASGALAIEENHRLYLPGLSREEGKKNGAFFERSEGAWFIDNRRSDAEIMRQRYGDDAAVEKANTRSKNLAVKSAAVAAAPALAVAAATLSPTRVDAESLLASDGGDMAVYAGASLSDKIAGASEHAPSDMAAFYAEVTQEAQALYATALGAAKDAPEHVSAALEDIQSYAQGIIEITAQDASDGVHVVGDELSAIGEKLSETTAPYVAEIEAFYAASTAGIDSAVEAAMPEAQVQTGLEAGSLSTPEASSSILDKVSESLSSFGESAVQAGDMVADGFNGAMETVYGMADGVGAAVTGKLATAGVLSAAGSVGGVAAVGWALAERRQRKDTLNEIAKDAPWVLKPKDFASVAKNQFKIERDSDKDALGNDAQRATIVDKTTGEPVMQVVSSGRTPARSIMTALHAEMVGRAERNGESVPEGVKVSLADAVSRMKIETRLRNDKAFDESVPVVRIASDASTRVVKDTAKALKERGDDFTRAATLKTSVVLAGAKDTAEKTALGLGIQTARVAMAPAGSQSLGHAPDARRDNRGRDR